MPLLDSKRREEGAKGDRASKCFVEEKLRSVLERYLTKETRRENKNHKKKKKKKNNNNTHTHTHTLVSWLKPALTPPPTHTSWWHRD